MVRVRRDGPKGRGDVLLCQHFQDPQRVPAQIAEFKAVPKFVRQHPEEATLIAADEPAIEG
jgi:hypothetical protein